MVKCAEQDNDLSFTIIFFVLIGSALYCHTCYSEKSWEDCSAENEQIYSCPPIHTVCYTTHRVSSHNGSEIHHYQRGCGQLHFCNGEECVRHGQWCKVTCCNTDVCNKSTFVAANYMTCPLIGLLTAVYLFWQTLGTMLSLVNLSQSSFVPVTRLRRAELLLLLSYYYCFVCYSQLFHFHRLPNNENAFNCSKSLKAYHEYTSGQRGGSLKPLNTFKPICTFPVTSDLFIF